MLGVRRQQSVSVAILILLWGVASGAASAQDAKLVAQCQPPQLIAQGVAAPAPAAPSGSAPPTGPSDTGPPTASVSVSCDVRFTDTVVFKGVKATVKGRSEPLDVQFSAFDPRNQTLAVVFMMQIMDGGRRAIVNNMADTIVKIAETRDGKRRYAAYSIANDLNLVADFSAYKADFEKQVRAVRTASLPTQLYKNTLEAIAKLAKEQADRKALVILGDGTSDDTGYTHDQVVKAAKDAGVVIHALGFVESASDLPNFQIMRRLADDTGGFRREARVGTTQRYTVTSQFIGEVLENGGIANVTLRQPPGPLTLALTADFTNGRFESADHSLTVPTPPVVVTPPLPQPVASETWYQRLFGWVRDNVLFASVIGVGLGFGVIGLALFGVGPARTPGALLTDKHGRPVIYGWLDMMDGNASRYPLKTTNVRIGRHRDNDICLQNDSISRRHALLHFNSDDRRFVITDLGGGNGVIVNKIKQQSHVLNDGDLVELGDVRLRFRANMELMG